MTLAKFFNVACDNAQRANVDKSWDQFWWAMDRIYAWEDWKAKRGKRRSKT